MTSDLHASEQQVQALVNSLDDFTRSYIEAMLWCGVDDEDAPLDRNYAADDIEYASLLRIERECWEFQQRAGCAIEQDAGQAGHHFYLTRTSHGNGFWNGDWGQYGDALAELAERFGEVYPVVDPRKNTIYLE